MNRLQKQMKREFEDKELFEQARSYAYEYIDGIEEMNVFPSQSSLKNLTRFDEPLQEKTIRAKEIIDQLHAFGSPATIAQIGGRYFGFVNGGAVPVSLGVKWLSDIWDQCGGLYLTSPVNAMLEDVCENWLKDIFDFPQETVAGFVSGTSMANLCGLAAARFHLLHKLGWNVHESGLNGAPKLRILAHEQVHASVKKTLGMLGFGTNSIEWLPSDDQGRLVVKELPKLDNHCLILLQAGNVNTGAFDDFDTVCDLANQVGAWVHIDGAFGLWARATKTLSHLTKGMEKASSWAVDGHKTLNTPYDSGIIMCRYPDALVSALQSTGEYIIYSKQRDPLLYTPEMSKRSRAIELWATMKYLGKDGIDQMITTFHERAKQLELGLRKLGLKVINDVVFNQVLIAGENDERTKEMIQYVQESKECWVGGSTWQEKQVIRISICSWMTSKQDIERTIAVFEKAIKNKCRLY
ncbi:aminotransferase class V-fold PLP-dependent enzyme [Aquimarina sp. AU474]|uniref:pyridoxal phosphate-dependent decarboxylase family protein n=1 Tax=Aquimarina sp. AU474 TaxID=2108529 RepID=UPI000D6A01DC|nr:aminotransferase class V-fold PLP-dependent enzyme [Aquimarina sp. AU474]